MLVLGLHDFFHFLSVFILFIASFCHSFQLNVCGAVADCSGTDTAACLGDDVLGKTSKKLEISDVGVITLTYEGTRNSQGQILHISTTLVNLLYCSC